MTKHVQIMSGMIPFGGRPVQRTVHVEQFSRGQSRQPRGGADIFTIPFHHRRTTTRTRPSSGPPTNITQSSQPFLFHYTLHPP
eukprot:CAMPEP_0178489744 /NCGR_PEP_ID=MMETSP0696-20121128/10535_2 /TAXON_ID=265572 /ORGANISM="Extubocellulus spinifer, Strain CCMP396" /LENGTH=82 /DNA_ID=CAMNT_0020117557 /DNA_START=123 /DNA_END=367 /DNA_ORIENTATION=-